MKKVFLCLAIVGMMFAGCKEDDPCEGITCLNDGQCNDGTCVCPTGWTGEFCQTSTDPCLGVNCANGGTCVNGTCVCATGWSGPNCETPVTVDPCDGINCQNGGTCSNGICTCPSGWTGTFCQTAVTPVGMKITQILLTDWVSNNWDNFSEGDIFMAVYRQQTSANIAVSSNQCDDCASNYTFNFVTPVMAVSELYDLDCWDYDSTDPNDYMGGITGFRPSSYMAGTPSTIQLTASGFSMQLTVQWTY